jgi:hypothetical protein
VIPAPATNFREVIHLPDCKSGVVKQSWKRRAGALPALPTSLRPPCSGQRLPRRSFSEGGLYIPSLAGYGSASHFWTRSSISRAPRCLREGSLRTATRVQLPSGPPFFTECSSVFRAPGLGPGGRR